MFDSLFNSLIGALALAAAIMLPIFAIGILINDLPAALIVGAVLSFTWWYIKRTEQKAEAKQERQRQYDMQSNLKQLPPPPQRNALDD